jgi:flavodoxin
MKLRKFILLTATLLLATACSGKPANNQQASTTAKNKTAKKALVVFFSHAGENYSVGNIATGNTKVVANYISDIIGADQFEITTNKYDGMDYKSLCDLAKKEQQKGELPEFDCSVDVSKYDTVFIGGPIWWGTYPQIVFTFFKKYDLSGKTVIPFTTHEGSGLGRCVEDVKEAYPKANVTKGFSMYGHDVRTKKSEVEKWLKGLGYK